MIHIGAPREYGPCGSAMSRPAISIDLGTCNAVVAGMTDVGEPHVILNRRGERKTRTVVAFTGKSVEIGVEPRRYPVGTVVRRVKDFVGDADWRHHDGDRSYRVEEIVAMIFTRLADDARRALGAAVTDVVLTVPTTFDALARRSVTDAAAIAGLRVRHLVNQPTAAALAYQILVDGTPAEKTVLAYGLGGGVCDVTVQRIGPDGVEVLASRGDRTLGGWDWDNVLIRIMQRRLSAAGGPDLLDTDAGEAYLRARAQVIKHRLSAARRADTVIRHAAASWTVQVSRYDFERACAPLVERTRGLVRATLADAGTATPHRVLLVGGPTRMPMVRQMVRDAVPAPMDPPHRPWRTWPVRPDEMVALGALLLAPHRSPGRRRGRRPRIREIATVGLGLLARDAGLGAIHNIVVVRAGTELPARGRITMVASEDGQTRAVVRVTQGNVADPRQVRVYGHEVVTLAGGPAGAAVEFTCSYDATQLPRFEVAGAVGRGSAGPVPVRASVAMSRAEIRRAADRLAVLLAG
jgi:molecular chaperone DnaK